VLLLTDYVIGLEAFVVVPVEIFSFPFVVAACTLITRFAAARPICGVGKVGLILSKLFVGVRLKIIWIGAFEVGVLARMLVGFVGLDSRASLVSLIPLSSLSVVALSAAALRVVARFVCVVAKHVLVPSLHGFLDFGAVLDVMRAEAFFAGIGRRAFDVEN